MLADLAALGVRLGVAATGNVEADAHAALENIAGRTEPWLLVYDNAPNADAVGKWLPIGGSVRSIITSRFVGFDGIATVTPLDQWSDQVTADYLLARTGRTDKDAALRLARTLGGLPLAAEQAAVHLRPRAGTSFDDYAADIAELIKRPRPKGATGEYPDTVYAAFVKSLETLKSMEGGETALDILRLCAFLSPDGIDLGLLMADEDGKVLPASFAKVITSQSVREDALAALVSLSLLRQESGPFGGVLIFHRLLLEVMRDWMGSDGRALWGSAAAEAVAGAFPDRDRPATDTSIWPLCAQLMPHVTPLDAHAPRTGKTTEALDFLFNQACLYLAARGDREGALTLAEKSVILARLTRDENPLGLAASLDTLGGRLNDLDRLDDAEKAYREALAIEEPRLDPNDSTMAITLSNLASVDWKRKRFADAEPLFLRAAEIIRATHGEGSAEYGAMLSNLDSLYDEWAQYSGDMDKRRVAEHYSTQALTVTRTARGTRHPETAHRGHNLAVLKARLDDWRGAAVEMERALAIMLSLDLAQHPSTNRITGNLIDMWQQSDQSDKAARLERGDISHLLPVIANTEAEHRAWVAEDPEHRHFGPPSPFEKQ